jgi:hypothetical protein
MQRRPPARHTGSVTPGPNVMSGQVSGSLVQIGSVTGAVTINESADVQGDTARADEAFGLRFRKFIAEAMDVVELFGVDVRRYRPRTALSMSYISLTARTEGQSRRRTRQDWNPGSLRAAQAEEDTMHIFGLYGLPQSRPRHIPRHAKRAHAEPRLTGTRATRLIATSRRLQTKPLENHAAGRSFAHGRPVDSGRAAQRRHPSSRYGRPCTWRAHSHRALARCPDRSPRPRPARWMRFCAMMSRRRRMPVRRGASWWETET